MTLDETMALLKAHGVKAAGFDAIGLTHVEFFPYDAPVASPTVTEAPAGSDVEAEPVADDPLYASA